MTPAFLEKSDSYSYSVYRYMNMETKEYYDNERIQWKITASSCTRTVEQMDANVEVMVQDLQVGIGVEQKRLWKMYEGR